MSISPFDHHLLCVGCGKDEDDRRNWRYFIGYIPAWKLKDVPWPHVVCSAECSEAFFRRLMGDE